MEAIENRGELDGFLSGADTALLYKHSPRCGICSLAVRQVEKLADRRPGLRVGVIDVLASRAVSDRAAERLGVRHASPQALLVREGEAVWHASHFGVRAGKIGRAIDRV